MPVWSVRLIQTACGWLLLGLAGGAVLLGAKGLDAPIAWERWSGFHTEAVLLGWMLQFTMGVAYWMLPKHAAGPERGREGPIAATFVLVNAGVGLAIVGPALAAPAALAAGRIATLAAVIAFASNVLPRVKPFGAGR